VGGKQVFFRGAAILDAVLADLLGRGLAQAKRVVVTGCSAGGLAAYLHCDYIAERLGERVQTKCMPDAGFFMDVVRPQGRDSG
jgi:dienelactone hydrolase